MRYWHKTETDTTITYKFVDGGMTILQKKGVKEGGTTITRDDGSIPVPLAGWEELIEDIKTYDHEDGEQ